MFIVALLRNGSTDFNEIFFVYSVGMTIGRKYISPSIFYSRFK